MPVPVARVTRVNGAPLRPDGEVIVYWMNAARRASFNFGLDRAIDHAQQLGKPLLVLEALRVGYRYASDRLHAFILAGMRDNAAAFEGSGIAYYPHVERVADESAGLLEALAAHACVVVTDDFPHFFLPRMVTAAGAKLAVRLEKVDSNGLFPMRSTTRVFTRAHSFRRFLQHELPGHLDHRPRRRPLQALGLAPPWRVPPAISTRWPRAEEHTLAGDDLANLPIDHTVAEADTPGGERAARKALRHFLDHRLERYGEGRNHPDDAASSQLSPYLHFGHLSVHEVLAELGGDEGWSHESSLGKPSGSREGFWGMSQPAESFLDELVTWREIGLNAACHQPRYDTYDALPDWAKATLAAHAADARPTLYSRKTLEAAETYDPVWNAAQRELVRKGTMHNYLRMLWGKKILEWSETPEAALEVMLTLNDRYALDGRDPNSVTGIFWVLGRYDRAWGPERPIFGKIRYMSSDSAKRKLHMKQYLERHGP